MDSNLDAFVGGLGSLLDLYPADLDDDLLRMPPLPQFPRPLSAEEADRVNADALFSDWRQVGDAMRTAMTPFKSPRD